jgi:hypothetical protein
VKIVGVPAEIRSWELPNSHAERVARGRLLRSDLALFLPKRRSPAD